MKYLYYIIISVVLFSSCKKELDFEYHYLEPKLVIEGILTEAGISTKLTFTTPMNESLDLSPITQATVSLIDATTGQTYNLECDGEGNFVNSAKGIVSHDYLLEVIHESNHYLAECEMRAATEITNLEFNWIKMPYDYVAVLQISFKDIWPKGEYYWIRIYRNNEAYQWLLCDNKGAMDGIINQVTMTSRKNLDKEDEKDKLEDGDIVKVEISTISRDMFDYLQALQTNSNGPKMFYGDFCLGYFLASGFVEKSIIYHPDELKE